MRYSRVVLTQGVVLSCFVHVVAAAAAFTPMLETALPHGNPAAYQRFGQSVAVEGLFAAVGAPGEASDPADPGTVGAGAVYVYQRTPAGWGLVQRVGVPEMASGWQFGSSVSLSGNNLVIGASGARGGVGAVFVYTWDGVRFGAAVELTPEGGAPYSLFGDPVVVRGDWLVVGAVGDGVSVPGSGAVYVYQRQASGWVQRGKLESGAPLAYANFGWSVDVENGRVVVGSPYESLVDPVSGAFYGTAGVAYVYQVDPAAGAPILQATLVEDHPENEAMLGYSVSLSGDAIVLGAPNSGLRRSSGGKVVVFRSGSGGWNQASVLVPGDAEANQVYGSTVRVRGGAVVVAAPGDSTLAGQPLDAAGTFYSYGASEGDWTLVGEWGAQERLAGDGFGNALGFDGHSLVVGVPQRTPSGCPADCSMEGAAVVFEVNQPPVAVATPASQQVTAADGVTGMATLSAGGSTDPDGDELTYRWLEGGVELGTGVNLSVALALGQHAIVLEVSDGRAVAQAGASVDVVRANRPPVARVAQAVIQVEALGPDGATVTLDASGSSDPDGDALSFSWREGSLNLGSAAVVQVRLGVGTHSVDVVVGDGSATAGANVVVTVTDPVLPPPPTDNRPPVADASLTATRYIAVDGKAAQVVLNGTRSSDPDGDVLTYRWLEGARQVAGGALASVKLRTGVHKLVLQVSDGRLSGGTSVQVQVQTPVEAVKALQAKLAGTEMPWARRLVAGTVLRNVVRLLERGQMRAAIQELEVFEIVLSAGNNRRADVRALIDEARWIRRALRGG